MATDGTTQAAAVFEVESQLTLTPTAGPVGGRVTASGTGFVASSPIQFTVGGISANSSCSSDPSGTFPGSSGTNCTFALPNSPGGVDRVIAHSGWQVLTSIGVGNWPADIAYDSHRGEMFLSDYNSYNVSVIDDATDQVAASVAVGSYPNGISYDAAEGEVFVADTATTSTEVSVISDTNDSVVSTVNAGVRPIGVVYDTGRGEEFIANSYSDNVSVLNTTRNVMVASIGGGSWPNGLAYDPALGYVYVVNSYSDNVSVINDSTNRVITSVNVGLNPYNAVYDSARAEVFVINHAAGTISVIRASSNRVVATIGVGSNPINLAYDPDLGEVFATNSGSDNVSVISDATDRVIQSVAVGGEPNGVAFDPVLSEVFVPNSLSDNVSVLASDTAVAVYDVNSSLAVAPPHGTAGESVAATGAGFAADSKIRLSFSGRTLNSNCSTDSTGSLPGSSGTECALVVPAVPAGTYEITASNAPVAPSVYVGSGPFGIAYDSGRGELFVSNSNSSNISVISDLNDTVVGTVTLGGSPSAAHPGAIAYDPGLGEVFVATGGDLVVINDTTRAIVATVGGVPGSFGLAYDAGRGELFATDFTTDAVSVISDRTNAIVATVPVGTQPWGIAYDPNQGELFVANSGSANVSVINDTTDTVSATIAVGNDSRGIALVSDRGELFLVNSGNASVSVISDSNDEIVATVPVQSQPSYAAPVPGRGEVLVSDSGSASVSVVLESTNTVTATLPAGRSPDAIAPDPGRGQVFVANAGSDNVSVSSAYNATAAFTVTPAVVLSPASGAVGSQVSLNGTGFAADSNVTFSLASLEVNLTCATGANGSFPRSGSPACTFTVPSVPGGSEPLQASDGTNLATANFLVTGHLLLSPTSGFVGSKVTATGTRFRPSSTVTFTVGGTTVVSTCSSDPNGSLPGASGTNCTFTVPATPHGSITVSAFDGRSVATAPFWVNSSVNVVPPGGSADVGQIISVQGSGFGSLLRLDMVLLGQSAVNCSSASVGRCVQGVLSSDSFGSIYATFVVPAVPAAGAYVLRVNDSAGDNASAKFTVNLDPTLAPPTASRPSADVGQSVVFGTLAALGAGGYTYAWIGLPSGCGGDQASINCSLDEAGRLSIYVRVVDSDGFAVTSDPLNFTVYADPTVATPGANLESAHVDGGQAVTFTTLASDGTSTYVSFIWSGLPSGCTGTTAAVNCSGADLPAGTYDVSVAVVDSNGQTSAASEALPFAVLADPVVALATPTATSADVGQSVTFSAHATLGSGSYAFTWAGLPNGCGEPSGPDVPCVLTGVGSYAIDLRVTDSNGFNVTIGPWAFLVYNDPAANVSSDRTELDVGQRVTLSANAVSGSGGYMYAWSGLPSSCASTTATLDCVPAEPGTYSVSVRVTDSNGASAESPAWILKVAAVLSAEVTATPAAPTSRQSITFAANASGGTGPLSYAWEFGDGGAATGPTVDHEFASSGVFTVIVWVNDSSGASVEKELRLSVTGPAAASGFLGPGAEELGAAVAVVGVAALLVFMLRRRAQARSSGDRPDPMPEEDPAPGAAPETGPSSDGPEGAMPTEGAG
jgi:YVTN family beta-propeller protein